MRICLSDSFFKKGDKVKNVYGDIGVITNESKGVYDCVTVEWPNGVKTRSHFDEVFWIDTVIFS